MELRCAWATRDPEYIEYHDKQWGRPVYDARELFAKLCLDGQQAGLSWITILKRTGAITAPMPTLIRCRLPASTSRMWSG